MSEGPFRPPSRAPTLDARKFDDFDDLDNDEEIFVPDLATPGLVDDEVKRLFDQHLEDARELTRFRSDQKGEEKKVWVDFIKQREEDWKKTTEKEGRNFLHVLAYYDYTRKPGLQWLMMRAISRHPKLMGALDDTKRTPLHIAIFSRNDMFVHAVCKNLKDDKRKEIGGVLVSECPESKSDREKRENDREEPTSLHAAFSPKSNITAEQLKIIIDFVPDEMFMVRDFQDRTPLHLAVDYEKCCGSQVGIVAELLRRNPEALDIRMRSDNWGCAYSVYQHHENTRRVSESKMLRGSGNEPHNYDGYHRSEADTYLQYKAREMAQSEPSRHTMTSSSHGYSHGYVARDGSHGAARRPSIAPAIGTPQDTGTPNMKVQRSKPSATDSPMNRDPISVPETLFQQQEDKRKSADTIREMLKLFYLRRKKPHEAARFLYLQEEKVKKQLWFDFGSKPKSKAKSKVTSPDEFKKHFGHLEFDSILQYVAVDEVQLRQEDTASSSAGGTEGRHDMVLLFDWLKDKGVKRIIKVMVDDLGSSPHSDEAIEKALEGLHVEILDWRRLDLCPLTIYRIGSDLRELHLRWSGRNAVLRSWSDVDGLARIPTLQNIHIERADEVVYCSCQHGKPCSGIVIHGGLNSADRNKKNLDDFETRLRSSWTQLRKEEKEEKDKKYKKEDKKEKDKRIEKVGEEKKTKETDNGPPYPKIHLPQGSTKSHAQATHQPHATVPRGLAGQRLQVEPNIDPHRWMKCMEEFANQFRQLINKQTKPENDPDSKPMTVALIDDGADITHPELHGKNFPGTSFHHYQDPSGSWRVAPFWDSASGHGTLMARLIHRVCPSAIIYVIKLQTKTPSRFITTTSASAVANMASPLSPISTTATSATKKNEITTESAIQALEHAVEIGANLISISWTMKKPDSPKVRERFDEALKRVKDIPVFCSAADQGRFPDLTYPHAGLPIGSSCSFRIGAAADTGSTPSFVGDAIDFIFPGHKVVIDQKQWSDYKDVDDVQLREFPSHTGSSVATALASGLAALVLECVRLGVLYSAKTGLKQSDAGAAIEREHMEFLMRDREAMKYALSSIGVSRQTDDKYIEVWNTFRDAAADLKKHDGCYQDQLMVMAGLARIFVQKARNTSR